MDVKLANSVFEYGLMRQLRIQKLGVCREHAGEAEAFSVNCTLILDFLSTLVALVNVSTFN